MRVFVQVKNTPSQIGLVKLGLDKLSMDLRTSLSLISIHNEYLLYRHLYLRSYRTVNLRRAI